MTQTVEEQVLAYARARLTAEGIAILRLIAAGQPAAEVAHLLEISKADVYALTKRIRRVLDARDAAHAVAIAYAIGLLEGMPS